MFSKYGISFSFLTPNNIHIKYTFITFVDENKLKPRGQFKLKRVQLFLKTKG